MDGAAAYVMIAIALALGTPFFIVFGSLSDRIGRLKIILAGCLIAALTYFPLFKALTHYVNPALEKYQQTVPITVSANPADCELHIFVGPWSKFSDCDKSKDYLTKAGLSFTSAPLPAGSTAKVVTKIGDTTIEGYDEKKIADTLKSTGYPAKADPSAINWPMALLILFIMMIYVTMVYGPIAAYLVELFPTRIRYTSMSLPYHIGNGWFGGMLPLLATALVAANGDIYYGLWYPIIVALMTFVVGILFLRDRKVADLNTDEGLAVGVPAR
jgi:MFS family permease